MKSSVLPCLAENVFHLIEDRGVAVRGLVFHFHCGAELLDQFALVARELCWRQHTNVVVQIALVAAAMPKGIVQYKSAPRRSKNGCSLTSSTTYKSPAGPPFGPGSPSPATRNRVPVWTPGGIRSSMVFSRSRRPCPRHSVQRSRTI